MTQEASFAGPPLCVVGNVNRDVKLLGVPGSPALFNDGETPVASVIETIGGGGANSACAAAALGANVRFVGRIGADALGERLRQAMERHGVQVRLAKDDRCVTGTSVALGFTSGQRHFLSCLPNNETLTFDDIDLAALDGCAHLLCADVWFSERMLAGGNRKLFVEARRRGLATSLDINFDPRWSTGTRAEIAWRKQQLREVLEWVDLAHGNRRELCEFTDCGDLMTALKRLEDWGVKAAVVHLGAEGAGYYAAGKWIIEPPVLAGRTMNSTGSGDMLSICMILLHHRPDLSIEQKLRWSNGVVCEFMEGRRTMIPTI